MNRASACSADPIEPGADDGDIRELVAGLGEGRGLKGAPKTRARRSRQTGSPRPPGLLRHELGLRHPGLLRCRGTLQSREYIYARMERCRESLGGELGRQKQLGQAIPRETALAVAGQVTAALAYLHNPDKEE